MHHPIPQTDFKEKRNNSFQSKKEELNSKSKVPVTIQQYIKAGSRMDNTCFYLSSTGHPPLPLIRVLFNLDRLEDGIKRGRLTAFLPSLNCWNASYL
ncbi:hypothetical protein TNCV_1758661 [Trichonephila clavipes]|nr:hypothetical protein TNCV_1758661 [Trichonephila clavipes]